MQHKFAKNKALEQKLIGQWRSHIPRNNLPKQFCERCFEQGDRKSQQKWLELVLELVFRVCVRQRKKMGARISGGGPPWAHEAGAWLGGSSSRGNFCTVNPQIFPKNHIKLACHSEDFYFWDIFILHG